MSEKEPIPAGTSEDPALDSAAMADPNLETMPSLEDLLRQAELRAEEHHDAWLRAKAEIENVRRRGAEEADKARKYAAEKFASDLLAVKDSLEAALASTGSTSIESLTSGVDVTLKQLAGVFERHQVVEISPQGEKFDPNQHQAIGMIAAEGEPNTVANVLQKGYLLNGRVLRPAMVMVIKPAE